MNYGISPYKDWLIFENPFHPWENYILVDELRKRGLLAEGGAEKIMQSENTTRDNDGHE